MNLLLILIFCRNWRLEYEAHVQTQYEVGGAVLSINRTVNDGVAHSKNAKKCAYHVTVDLDLEHTLDAR